MYQAQQQNQALPPPQQAPQITQMPIQQSQINHANQVPQVTQVPMQQQYIVTSGNYTPAPPSATMAVATSNNTNYIQSAAVNPSQHTTTMETSSFDRDKQIYKCSTLGRHVGKYNEQRQNQNLVPAVIPTVPQIPKYNGQQQQITMAPPNNHLTSNNLSSTLRPSIQNCPLPDIPNIQTSTFKSNNDTIGNDLPQTRYVAFFIDFQKTTCFPLFRFYTQKRPTGKAVPLPKISSFESNQPPYLNNNHQSQPISDNNCNMKNSVNNNVNSIQMNNNQQHQILPPPPPEPTTDENYAVTEL